MGSPIVKLDGKYLIWSTVSRKLRATRESPTIPVLACSDTSRQFRSFSEFPPPNHPQE